MPTDLVIAKGQTILFDDNVERSLQKHVEKVPIETLKDLVANGLVSSEAKLTSMLNAAREATSASLQSIISTRNVPLVPGSSKVDLGRYRPFVVRAPEVSNIEREGFWRIFRDVPSDRVAALEATTKIKDLLPWWNQFIFIVNLRNVTIEAGATLAFSGAVKKLTCNDLLIRRTGRIKVVGSGLVVKAKSIKGEQ